jgi:phage FluMu protein Com
MFPTTLRVGVWYIAALCPHCKRLIPLFRDLTQGASNFRGSYQMTCPECKHKGVFEGQHYQPSTTECLPDVANAQSASQADESNLA